jgi:ferredoxin-type protein NapF
MLSRRQFLQIDRLRPPHGPLTVSDRCLAMQHVRCLTCQETCPEEAISVLRTESLPQIDFARCSQCGDCVPVCPTQALALHPTAAPERIRA